MDNSKTYPHRRLADGAAEVRPYITIKPQSKWQAINVGQLWQYRDLLMTLGMRDIKLRYRQTALGAIWVLVQPVLAAAIFSFVFNRVAGLDTGNIPAFLYAYTGMLGWNLFATTLNKTSLCLIQNTQLVSKVFFPRLILPLSTVFSSLVDLGVGLAVVPLLLLKFHIFPGASLLLLPLWVALLLLLALGAGLYAAGLMVSYRDIQYIVPVLTNLLLYACPIAYTLSRVPARYLPVYLLNPLVSLLTSFRSSLLGTDLVGPAYLACTTVTCLVVFCAGALAFRSMERRFADVI